MFFHNPNSKKTLDQIREMLSKNRFAHLNETLIAEAEAVVANINSFGKFLRENSGCINEEITSGLNRAEMKDKEQYINNRDVSREFRDYVHMLLKKEEN